jgi:hypothetical protein
MEQQQQYIHDFSKCVGQTQQFDCPVKSECKRFTEQSVQPPAWQPWFLIIPYNQQKNSCELKVNNG